MATTSTVDILRRPFAPGTKTDEPPARIYEKALTLAAMGFHGKAAEALRDVAAREPGHAPAWEKLAQLLRMEGRSEEANAAASRAAGHKAAWPAAADPRSADEIDTAERALQARMAEIATPPQRLKALRDQLRSHETDVTAMRLLARLHGESGDLMTARALFERALVLAPEYEGVRRDLVLVLREMREDARVAAETAWLIGRAPANVAYRAMRADALRACGDLSSAISVLAQLVCDEPAQARFRCVYAEALRVAGRREESAREFRACLALEPGMGEAYWGLAELRGNFLGGDDIAAMREHLRDSSHADSGRMLLQNALGQALERAGDFSASFAAYEAGATLAQTIAFNTGQTYNPITESDQMRRRRAVFTASVFAGCAPGVRPACTPIFVVGLPRAGSTLVEQILASHSLVEGTLELPVLGNIARDLSVSRFPVAPDAYPECVADLSSSELAALGARYLKETAIYRKTKSTYFIDKRPWNGLHAGLIRLVLPHAKIVDVRREPMAACFAMYKHMQAKDVAYPHEFGDLARHYTEYVAMMAHYDRAMPGHIHFLSYERLVEDTETEIRRLLDYCGLPFEEGCLRFWETERNIATPSSEQVRRPIYGEALYQWRNFEPWLRPLRQALNAAQIEAAAAPQPKGYEHALTLSAMSVFEPAIEELQTITRRVPTHPGASLKLSELLRLAGRDMEADKADAAAVRYAGNASKWQSTRDTRTIAQLHAAERKLLAELSVRDWAGQMDMLRERLAEIPTDALATRVLAGIEAQDGDYVTARALLERTLELSPLYHLARAELAALLMTGDYFVRALEQTTILVHEAPGNSEYRAIHSDALARVGDLPAAVAVREELLREDPRDPDLWHAYGHLQRHLGRRDDSARAFRRCLDIEPTKGQAYWGLASLRGSLLTDTDVSAMRGCLVKASLEPSSRMYMYYALGHALERRGDFSASFTAYQEGARLFRGSFLTRGEAYSDSAYVELVGAMKRVYTARLLDRIVASPATSPAVTPIFIVGMPRAGSTLVEQILASHSKVEGTHELPLIGGITSDLALSRRIIMPDAYPDCVLDMAPARLAALGERYLKEARRYRKTERPYFIDKRPWNWLDAGLIHLILPHAKIIDVRREPMAACFAMFKQVLTDGADFSYDLRDLGHYYTEYVGLMNHYASVLPGRIHFVQYECLVENTEGEIRRLLDYCGLPFEQGCLRYWETDRAVITPSAEQVRRPIYRDAVEQWRNFEPWLGPLKEALSEPTRA
jgi:tetratricopeptide (TPR) repeat protein